MSQAAHNPGGTLTILAVRIVASGGHACGNIGIWSAYVAVASNGAPVALPTPDPDGIEGPTTGFAALSGRMLLPMPVVGSAVVHAGGAREDARACAPNLCNRSRLPQIPRAKRCFSVREIPIRPDGR